MSGSATRLGEVLNDAYELEELLSSSGPLEVYRATDRRTRSAVRVRLLRPEFALQGAVVESFLRGPRALAKLSHENIPLLRLDSDNTGIPFVVEEAVEGRTLASLIESFPQGLPLPLITQLYVPLAEALALAHEHGLVHGRIDDASVKLLGESHAPTPKLLGLGAANEDRAEQDAAYRAPELSSKKQRPTPSSDVYALGVLLYRMLSGELPFRSGKKSAVPLDEIAPHLPSAWVKLTRACLETKPGKRLADARALVRELRACSGVNAPRQQSAAAAALPTAQTVVAPPALHTAPTVAAVAAQHAADTRAARAAPHAAETLAADPPAPHAGDTRAGSVATAFDALIEEAPQPTAARKSGKDKRKRAARDAAAKLGAKTKPSKLAQAREPAQSSAAPQARRESPRPATATAAVLEGSIPLDRKRVSKPAAAATPAQTAAVALTEAQLTALRALRAREPRDRERVLGVFIMLLFMLLLQLGVPLLYEPNLVRAQALFGPRLQIVAAAFAVIAVIGAVRVWVAQIQQRSPLNFVTSYLLHAVTACILVMTAALFSQSPGLALVAAVAHRVLPWGMGGLFFMFALRYGVRGMRELAGSMLFGALLLAVAGGSLYGAYYAVGSTWLKEKRRAAASTVAPEGPNARRPRAGSAFGELKQELIDKTAATGTQGEGQGSELEQRQHAGADEVDDLRSTQQIEDTRAKNRQSLERLGKGLPAATNGAESSE